MTQGLDREARTPRITVATPEFAVPEFYVDGSAYEASVYTVTLVLGTSMSTGHLRPSTTIRMSHTHAKVLAMALKRFLKQTEEALGAPIAIPKQALEETGLSLDDW